MNRSAKFLSVVIIVTLILIFYSQNNSNKKRSSSKHGKVKIVRNNGTDTIEIDISKWDSIQVDSFIQTLNSESDTEDDSLYKLYKLDEIDSLMKLSDSPLIDSILTRKD